MNTLESRAAIADLVHRYALNVRRGQGHACALLFTEDASFEVRDIDMTSVAGVPSTRARVVGHDAIKGYVSRSTTSGICVCPIIQNLLIVVNGNEATSNCLMATRTWPASHESMGEYDDSYRLVNGEWYFASRIFTIFKATSTS